MRSTHSASPCRGPACSRSSAAPPPKAVTASRPSRPTWDWAYEAHHGAVRGRRANIRRPCGFASSPSQDTVSAACRTTHASACQRARRRRSPRSRRDDPTPRPRARGGARDGARWHYVEAAHHHPRLPRRDPAWLPRSLEMFLRLHDERRFDVIHSESTSAIEFVRRGVYRRVPVVAKFHGSGLAHTRAHVRRMRSGDVRAKVHQAKGLVWLFGVWFQYGQLYRFRPCVWMVPSKREFDDTRRSHCLKAALGHVVPNGVDTHVFAPLPPKETRADLGFGDLPLFVSAARLEARQRYARCHSSTRASHTTAGNPATASRGRKRAGARKPGGLELRARPRKNMFFSPARSHTTCWRATSPLQMRSFSRRSSTRRRRSRPLQALACGSPVIASSVGSVPESIGRAGECGLLYPPGRTRGARRGISVS